MNRGRVMNGTCCSRAPDAACHVVPSQSCRRTYNHAAKNMATDVHKGGASNAYSCIRTVRAHVHGEAEIASCSLATNRLGQNGETMSCSSGEATDWVRMLLFIGNQPAWTEQPKWGPVIDPPPARGVAYCKTYELKFSLTAYDRNRVLFIGRGLSYRKTKEMNLVGYFGIFLCQHYPLAFL
jgi:hypothetical protein